MFKIGEFSKLTQVSVRMLRYYDEQGILKPSRTDPVTGYRSYTSEQIPKLQRILFLRDLDFQVNEIAQALAHWQDRPITDLLEHKKLELLAEMAKIQDRVDKIDIAVRDVQARNLDVHCNVILKSIPELSVLSLRRRIPDHFCEGDLWLELNRFVMEEHVALDTGVNNLALFYDENEGDSEVDVEVCCLVKKPGIGRGDFVYRLIAGEELMACVMVYGPYQNIGTAYHTFARWLEEHRYYEMRDPVRQICHLGPFNEENPERYLTEIQVPLKRRD